MSEQKTIFYHLVAKGLIKFTDSDKSYPLSEGVTISHLHKGDNVEVVIENDKITSIKKVEANTATETPAATKIASPANPITDDVTPPKEIAPPPPVEQPKTNTNPVAMKELTVFAVMTDKRLVRFTELPESGWLDIAPDVQALDYPSYGFVASSKIKAAIVDNVVTKIEKVAQTTTKQSQDAPSDTKPARTDNPPAAAVPTPAPSVPKKEWKPYNAQEKDDYWTKKFDHDKEHFDVKESEKQASIEAQACMNSACQVVGMVAAAIARESKKSENGVTTTNAPTANAINNMIKSVAEANYALLQELKKK